MKRKISLILLLLLFALPLIIPSLALSKTIAVASLKLSKTSVTLVVGKSVQLAVTISPSNATNKTIRWSTNSSNASVKNGKITAIKDGVCIVTTKSNNGKTATCLVTIKVNSISWAAGEYEVGKDIPAGEYIITSCEGFSVYTDSSKSNKIVDDSVTHSRQIVTVKAGECFVVKAGIIYPIATAPKKSYGNGTYKVGTDIAAGNYTLSSAVGQGNIGVYYIYSNSTHEKSALIAYKVFSKETYITLINGEYLEISSCNFPVN